MQNDINVLSTWTDELNAALDPLGILLSGVDAASILSLPKHGSVMEKLRSVYRGRDHPDGGRGEPLLRNG